MGEDVLLCVRMPRGVAAVAATRAAMAALNDGWKLLDRRQLDDVQLLVSELVTNAVRYGEGEHIALCARATATALRVEVTNRGAVFDPMQRRAPPGPVAGGWGLEFVKAVA